MINYLSVCQVLDTVIANMDTFRSDSAGVNHVECYEGDKQGMSTFLLF